MFANLLYDFSDISKSNHDCNLHVISVMSETAAARATSAAVQEANGRGVDLKLTNFMAPVRATSGEVITISLDMVVLLIGRFKGLNLYHTLLCGVIVLQ